MGRFLTNSYSGYAPKVVGDTLEREEALLKIASNMYNTNKQNIKKVGNSFKDLPAHSVYSKSIEKAGEEYDNFAKTVEEDGRYEFFGDDIDKTTENLTDKYHIRDIMKNSEAINNDLKTINESEHASKYKQLAAEEALDQSFYEEDGVTPKKYKGTNIPEYVELIKESEALFKGWKDDGYIERNPDGTFKILNDIPGYEMLSKTEGISENELKSAAKNLLSSDDKMSSYIDWTSKLDAREYVKNKGEENLSLLDILQNNKASIPIDSDSMNSEINEFRQKAIANNLSREEIIAGQKEIQQKYHNEAAEEFLLNEQDNLDAFLSVYEGATEEDYIFGRLQEALKENKIEEVSQFLGDKFGFKKETLQKFKKEQEQAYRAQVDKIEQEKTERLLNMNIGVVETETNPNNISNSYARNIEELNPKIESLEEEVNAYKSYQERKKKVEESGGVFEATPEEKRFETNYNLDVKENQLANLKEKRNFVKSHIHSENNIVLKEIDKIVSPEFFKEVDFPESFTSEYLDNKYKGERGSIIKTDDLFKYSLGESLKNNKGSFNIDTFKDNYISNIIKHYTKKSFKERNKAYSEEYGKRSELDADTYFERNIENLKELNEVLKIKDINSLVNNLEKEYEIASKSENPNKSVGNLIDNLNQQTVELLNKNKNNTEFETYVLNQVNELQKGEEGNWFEDLTGIQDSNPFKSVFKAMQKYNPKVNIQNNTGFLDTQYVFASGSDKSPFGILEGKLNTATSQLLETPDNFKTISGKLLSEEFEDFNIKNATTHIGINPHNGSPVLFLKGSGTTIDGKAEAFTHQIILDANSSPTNQRLKRTISSSLNSALDLYLDNPESLKDEEQKESYNNLLSSALAFDGTTEKLIQSGLYSINEGEVKSLNLKGQNLNFVGIKYNGKDTYATIQSARQVVDMNGNVVGNGNGVYGYLPYQVDKYKNPKPGESPQYVDERQVFKGSTEDSVVLNPDFIPAEFDNETEMLKNMFTDIIVNKRSAVKDSLVFQDWENLVNQNKTKDANSKKLGNTNTAFPIIQNLNSQTNTSNNYKSFNEVFGEDYYSEKVAMPYFNFKNNNEAQNIGNLIKGNTKELGINFTNLADSSLFITGGSDHKDIDTKASGRVENSNHFEGRALDVLANPAMRDLYDYYISSPKHREELANKLGITSIHLDPSYKYHYHINF